MRAPVVSPRAWHRSRTSAPERNQPTFRSSPLCRNHRLRSRPDGGGSTTRVTTERAPRLLHRDDDPDGEQPDGKPKEGKEAERAGRTYYADQDRVPPEQLGQRRDGAVEQEGQPDREGREVQGGEDQE